MRKSCETIETLRRHLHNVAATSKTLRSRAGASYDPKDTIDRVHFLTVQLDLCDLDSVYAAADQLVHGTIGDPTDKTGTRYRVPRLDGVILNAGLGGWTGVSWPGLAWKFLRSGLIQMCTFPDFKMATTGLTVEYKPTKSVSDQSPHVLGQVFCGNVFGHYLLCHELLPLLSRASYDERRGRIIWTSSLEGFQNDFKLDDPQGLTSPEPYESSKRLTDLLALTHQLPAGKKQSASYFTIEDPEVAAAKPIAPAMYTTHPGIVHSTLFPISWVLASLYKFALYLCRWLGSSWHPVTGYLGATASVWAVLNDGMEEEQAHRVKWGSSTDVWGTPYVKKTEVDGWGWEGVPEDAETLANENVPRVVRKLTGRRPPTKDLTPEALEEFEETGAKAWAEMERLRREWEGITGRRTTAANGRGP